MNKTTATQQTKTAGFILPAQGLLQRKCACGNHTVAGSECAECANKKTGLQRKLSMGASHDPLEREADRVAAQVMRCPAHSGLSSSPLHIQRFTGQSSEQTATVPASVNRVLNGSGRPLDTPVRKDMESRFGHDFSQVRVHQGGDAEQSAQDVNAYAYTVGKNIVFAQDRFSPTTQAGRLLLAHELAHVIQQDAGVIRRMPKDAFGRPLGFFPTPEQEAYDKETYEIKEWEKVLARLDKGELDDRDLANSRLRNRLTGLTTTGVNALIVKITDYQKKNPALSVTKLTEWLEVRKEISTPMPDGATVNRDPITSTIDSYTLNINNVTIKVVADSFGSAQNDTGPVSSFGRSYKWHASNNIIDSLINQDGGNNVPINPNTFEVTIQTRYAQNPNDVSGYGRGTTEDDKREKTTTLRVHEGSHGTDFINYIKNTPFPVDISKGIVNVLTVAEMRKIDAYISNMTKETCESTDQVGFSQDEFLKTAQGKVSGIKSCRKP
jgi:hypothetical protein